MSRVEKQRKRQHRKERKSEQAFRRHRRSCDGIVQYAEPDGFNGNRSPRQVLDYEITYDAIPQPTSRLNALLSDDERAQLFAQATDDPAAAIPRLHDLLAHVPDSPMLLNWLARCHSCLSDNEEADRLSRLNAERNPDYLFAKINLAQAALQRGDLGQIPLLFDNKFDLKLLYPGRSTFHVTEYIAFASIMVEYYMRIDEHEAARMLFGMMEQIDPNNRETVRLRKLLDTSVLLQAFQKMLGILRPGKLGR